MAGLIGPDVLSQFDVTFDYARTRIIFERNTDYGRRDSYDRAGIWMGHAPDGKYFTVVDVIADGPGADAGVKQGDQILAINGESTASLILPDVRETIRRGTIGEKLTLLLQTGYTRRIAVVTLKDLV
jgi:C-terminal processing protease CtpA/Prc